MHNCIHCGKAYAQHHLSDDFCPAGKPSDGWLDTTFESPEMRQEKAAYGVAQLTLGGMQLTKSNAAALGNMLAEKVLDGHVSALEAVANLRAAALAIETALGLIEGAAIEEARKHPKSVALLLGAKLEVAETGVKYDYSGCPKWAALKAKSGELGAAMKQREAFLKTLSKPLAETDMETGETLEVLPPVRTSGTSLKVTLGA